MRKYDVGETVNVVFRAKSTLKMGEKTFYKDEPVYWFDTLTTSSLAGADIKESQIYMNNKEEIHI